MVLLVDYQNRYIMKKSERKILEKKIEEAVNILVGKYEPQPVKKIRKIVNEAAKSISKKVYKETRELKITVSKKSKTVKPQKRKQNN